MRIALEMLCAILMLAAVQTPPTANSERDSKAVFAVVRKAAGKPAAGASKIVRATGRESAFGLEGAWTYSVDQRDGRFRREAHFGAFSTGLTFDGSTEWRTDRSGGVHALDGAFARRNARTDAWLARLGYLRPQADGAAIGLVERRERDGRAFEVVTATPAAGEPVELWFDAQTYLLVMTVRRGAISTVIQHLSEYSVFEGLQLPHRIVSEEGDERDEVTVTAYSLADGPGADELRPPAYPTDVVLERPTTVPLEIGNYPVVEARLNDEGPFAFILDTGGHSILTPAAVQALGLKPVGSSVSGGAGAGTLTQQDVTVRRVRIGDAELRDHHFYVIPLQYATIERGSRPPLAGIIGAELLERLAARIDYRASRLTLAPFGQAEGICRGTRVPLRFDDDLPLVNGEVDGKPGVLAIDSGNGGSTVVQGVWAARTGLTDRLKGGIESTSFGAGGASTNWTTHGGDLALGSVRVPDVDLRYANDKKGAFSSTTEAANVGQQVLARFNVTFDYRRERMCLQPEGGYVPPPLSRSGVTLLKTQLDRFEVISVVQGSAGAVAGVQTGDIVIAVDGRPASTLSGQDVGAIVRQPAGRPVRLTIARAGETVEKAFVLKEP